MTAKDVPLSPRPGSYVEQDKTLEGVETRAEWNLAADLGADCIQGYYIAKPMAAGELVGWFNSWRMS